MAEGGRTALLRVRYDISYFHYTAVFLKVNEILGKVIVMCG